MPDDGVATPGLDAPAGGHEAKGPAQRQERDGGGQAGQLQAKAGLHAPRRMSARWPQEQPARIRSFCTAHAATAGLLYRPTAPTPRGGGLAPCRPTWFRKTSLVIGPGPSRARRRLVDHRHPAARERTRYTSPHPGRTMSPWRAGKAARDPGPQPAAHGIRANLAARGNSPPQPICTCPKQDQNDNLIRISSPVR